MEEFMEFFAENDCNTVRQSPLPEGEISQINGLPIVTRIETGGDFDNWSGGLYPAKVEIVRNDDESVKTAYLYEEFTYIFKVISFPEFVSEQESEISPLQIECAVGDEVYLKFYQGKMGDFLVCCKYEEHE